MDTGEHKAEMLLYNLNALAELGEEMASQKDIRRIVRSSLLMVMGTFSSSKGVILRYDYKTRALGVAEAKGIDGLSANIGGNTGTGVGIGSDRAGALVSLNAPFELALGGSSSGGGRGKDLLGPAEETLLKYGVTMAMPLVVTDELLGLIAINGKFSGEGFTGYDLRLLSVMARHIAVSLHGHSLLGKLMHKYNENKALYDDLLGIYNNTIQAFAAAIDAKDAYTNGHSLRVSTYALAVAHEMGLSEDEREGIRIGGLLHDIGKLAVDKTIINKPSRLSESESQELNCHPVVGYDILSKVKFPWRDIANMARNHHEKPNGSGYPDGLKSGSIPLGARILALADSFDAMTTDRPYRTSLSFGDTMAEIKKYLSIQFDPEIVRPFLSVLKKESTGKAGEVPITTLLKEKPSPELVVDIVDNFMVA